jgi:hypothetical protein
MLSRLKNIDTVMTLLMAIIGATVYVLTSFATVEYVDKRHSEMKKELKEDISDIKTDVRIIKDFILKHGGK